MIVLAGLAIGMLVAFWSWRYQTERIRKIEAELNRDERSAALEMQRELDRKLLDSLRPVPREPTPRQRPAFDMWVKAHGLESARRAFGLYEQDPYE